MNMFNSILNCIGIIIIAIGIICVYDARNLTKRHFSTSDTNSATRTLKIIGFIMFCIGSGIFLF